MLSKLSHNFQTFVAQHPLPAQSSCLCLLSPPTSQKLPVLDEYIPTHQFWAGLITAQIDLAATLMMAASDCSPSIFPSGDDPHAQTPSSGKCDPSHCDMAIRRFFGLLPDATMRDGEVAPRPTPCDDTSQNGPNIHQTTSRPASIGQNVDFNGCNCKESVLFVIYVWSSFVTLRHRITTASTFVDISLSQLSQLGYFSTFGFSEDSIPSLSPTHSHSPTTLAAAQSNQFGSNPPGPFTISDQITPTQTTPTTAGMLLRQLEIMSLLFLTFLITRNASVFFFPQPTPTQPLSQIFPSVCSSTSLNTITSYDVITSFCSAFALTTLQIQTTGGRDFIQTMIESTRFPSNLIRDALFDDNLQCIGDGLISLYTNLLSAAFVVTQSSPSAPAIIQSKWDLLTITSIIFPLFNLYSLRSCLESNEAVDEAQPFFSLKPTPIFGSFVVNTILTKAILPILDTVTTNPLSIDQRRNGRNHQRTVISMLSSLFHAFLRFSDSTSTITQSHLLLAPLPPNNSTISLFYLIYTSLDSKVRGKATTPSIISFFTHLHSILPTSLSLLHQIAINPKILTSEFNGPKTLSKSILASISVVIVQHLTSFASGLDGTFPFPHHQALPPLPPLQTIPIFDSVWIQSQSQDDDYDDYDDYDDCVDGKGYLASTRFNFKIGLTNGKITITSNQPRSLIDQSVVFQLTKLTNALSMLPNSQLESSLVMITTFVESYCSSSSSTTTIFKSPNQMALGSSFYCNTIVNHHSRQHITPALPQINSQVNPARPFDLATALHSLHTQPLSSNYRDLIDSISQSFESTEFEHGEYLDQLSNAGKSKSKANLPTQSLLPLAQPWTGLPSIRDHSNPLLAEWEHSLEIPNPQVAMWDGFSWDICENPTAIEVKAELIKPEQTQRRDCSGGADQTLTLTSHGEIEHDSFDAMPSLIGSNDDPSAALAPVESNSLHEHNPQFFKDVNVKEPFLVNTPVKCAPETTNYAKSIFVEIELDLNPLFARYQPSITSPPSFSQTIEIGIHYYTSSSSIFTSISKDVALRCQSTHLAPFDFDQGMFCPFASYLFGEMSRACMTSLITKREDSFLTLLGTLSRLIDLAFRGEQHDFDQGQRNAGSLLSHIVRLVAQCSSQVDMNFPRSVVAVLLLLKMISRQITPTDNHINTIKTVLRELLPNVNHSSIDQKLVNIVVCELGLAREIIDGHTVPFDQFSLLSLLFCTTWVAPTNQHQYHMHALPKPQKWVYPMLTDLFYELSLIQPIRYIPHLMRVITQSRSYDQPVPAINSLLSTLTSPSLSFFRLTPPIPTQTIKHPEEIPNSNSTILHSIRQTLSLLLQTTVPDYVNGKCIQSQLLPISLLPQSISTINVKMIAGGPTTLPQHLTTISHHKLLIQQTKQTTLPLKKEHDNITKFESQPKLELIAGQNHSVESTTMADDNATSKTSNTATTTTTTSDQTPLIPYLIQPRLSPNNIALNSSIAPICITWSPLSLLNNSSHPAKCSKLIKLMAMMCARYRPLLLSDGQYDALPFLDLSTAYRMLFKTNSFELDKQENVISQPISLFNLWKFEILALYKSFLANQTEIVSHLGQSISSASGALLQSPSGVPILSLFPHHILCSALGTNQNQENPTRAIHSHLRTLINLYHHPHSISSIDNPNSTPIPSSSSIQDLEAMLSNDELSSVLRTYLKSQFFPSQTSLNLAPSPTPTLLLGTATFPTSSTNQLLPSTRSQTNQNSSVWEEEYQQTVAPISTTGPIATLIPALSPFALTTLVKILLDRVELAIFKLITSNTERTNPGRVGGARDNQQPLPESPAQFISNSTELLFVLLLTLLPWSQQLTSIQYERLLVMAQRHNQLLTQKPETSCPSSLIKHEQTSVQLKTESIGYIKNRGNISSDNISKNSADSNPIQIIPVLQSNSFLLTQTNTDQDVTIASGSDYITQNLRSQYLSIQIKSKAETLRIPNQAEKMGGPSEINPALSQLDSYLWMSSTQALSHSRLEQWKNQTDLSTLHATTIASGPTLTPDEFNYINSTSTTPHSPHQPTPDNHSNRDHSHQVRFECSPYMTSLRDELVRVLQRIVDHLPLIDRALLSESLESTSQASSLSSTPLCEPVSTTMTDDTDKSVNVSENINTVLLSTKLNDLFSIPSLGGPGDLPNSPLGTTKMGSNLSIITPKSEWGEKLNQELNKQLIETNYALFSLRFLDFVSVFTLQNSSQQSATAHSRPASVSLQSHLPTPLSVNNRPPTLSTTLQLIQNLGLTVTNTALTSTIERIVSRFLQTAIQNTILTSDWATLLEYLGSMELPSVLPGALRRQRQYKAQKQGQESHLNATSLQTELELINFLFPLLLQEFHSGPKTLKDLISSSLGSEMSSLENQVFEHFLQSKGSRRINFKRFMRDRLISLISTDPDDNEISPQSSKNQFLLLCVNLFDPFNLQHSTHSLPALNQFLSSASAYIYAMLDLPPHYFIHRYSRFCGAPGSENTVQVQPITALPQSNIIHFIPTMTFSYLLSLSQSHPLPSTPTASQQPNSAPTHTYHTTSPSQLNHLAHQSTLHFDDFFSSRLALFQTQLCKIKVSGINLALGSKNQVPNAHHTPSKSHYLMFPNPFLPFNKAMLYPILRKHNRVHLELMFINLLSLVNYLWSRQLSYLELLLNDSQLAKNGSSLTQPQEAFVDRISHLTSFTIAIYDLVELVLIAHVNSYYSLNLDKIPTSGDSIPTVLSLLTIISHPKSANSPLTSSPTPNRMLDQHHQYSGGIHSRRAQQQQQQQKKKKQQSSKETDHILSTLATKFNLFEHYTNGIDSNTVTSTVGNNQNVSMAGIFEGFSAQSKVPLIKMARIHIDFSLQLWSTISLLLAKCTQIDWSNLNHDGFKTNQVQQEEPIQIISTYLSYKTVTRPSPQQQQQLPHASASNIQNYNNNPIIQALNVVQNTLKTHLDFDLDWYSSLIIQRGSLSRSFPIAVTHGNTILGSSSTSESLPPPVLQQEGMSCPPSKSILSVGVVHPLGFFMGYLMQYIAQNKACGSYQHLVCEKHHLYDFSQQLLQRLRKSTFRPTRRKAGP